MYCNIRCSGIIQFRWQSWYSPPRQSQLEHDPRKPPNESGLLVSALRTLKSNPLLYQHLHPARLLHPQDALAQLLSVGGPWEFLCWGWKWEWLSSTTTTHHKPHKHHHHQHHLHHLGPKQGHSCVARTSCPLESNGSYGQPWKIRIFLKTNLVISFPTW